MSFSSEERKWLTHVKATRSFIDETYRVTLPGKSSYSAGSSRLPWGRTGLEKFYDRIIPYVHGGGELTKEAEVYIREAAKDAVTFGNSTIIVNGDGSMRVSTPETGVASKDVFGNITFREQFADGTETYAENGEFFVKDPITEIWSETSLRAFSIFYNANGNAPQGTSRLSPAIRSLIKAATRNQMRAEVAADFTAFPQRIINGFWEGMEAVTSEAATSMEGGIDKVLAFPEGPQGQRLEVTQFAATDFTQFLKLKESFARDCASAFNIDVAELGVTTAVPSSADALYMSKEDLVVEIEAFEKQMSRTLQNLVEHLYAIESTFVSGLAPAKLTWAEAATPSKASQADAFVKLAGAIPAMSSSRKALAWAGLPGDLAEELAEEMYTDHTRQVLADSGLEELAV